ncbi:zf-HC2 domain-containing protein [Paucibacter sp. TC2R-5]|uniref:anti-sigma factor family protein n=1 Tax=Paucibacter sp. TC2R-5 TaxID=2893555 RepID=UPI0021E4B197|nr:zf-HC2 domain-containing protein [Paucibacter sp. TC2R-5]MCV2358345.1 zf-HC2 domain-containing protein [Paucibacter sp. TC2R-5]
MMGLPNCREVTRLVLEGEERPLRSSEKLAVRAHFLICKACTNFGKQVELMSKASARWRGYSGE